VFQRCGAAFVLLRFLIIVCWRAAVAEQALTSQPRPATANHAVSTTSPPTAKPEVTSASSGDRKQRNAGGPLQQLSVVDFRTTSTNAGLKSPALWTYGYFGVVKTTPCVPLVCVLSFMNSFYCLSPTAMPFVYFIIFLIIIAICMRNVAAGIALLFLAVYLFLFIFVCFLTACCWRNKDAYITCVPAMLAIRVLC